MTKKKKNKVKKFSAQGLMRFTGEQIGLGIVSNAGPAAIGFLPSFPGQAGTMRAMKPLRMVPRIHATGFFISGFSEMGNDLSKQFDQKIQPKQFFR